MSRLPVPGGDKNSWGTILNDFLLASHAADGTIKPASITESSLSSAVQTKLNLPTNIDPTVIVAADAPTSWQNLSGVVKASGTNDQTVLAAAINAGPVFLSPGTFHLSGSITITNPAPSITGSGWSSVLKLNNGANSWAIVFNPPANGIRGSFSNFTIDGNASNQSAGGGIHASGSVQSEYHLIHFLNSYSAGLWLDGFPSSAFGHHNKVVSCLFDADITPAGEGRGLLITSSDENYIRSDFQFLGSTSGSVFAIRDQAGLNTFEGSVFVGGRNNAGGIELRDGQRSKVVGCTFDGVSGNNIMAASSAGHVITNNMLTSVADQATSNGTYSGIYLEFSVTNCVVSHNVLDTSQTSGRTRSLIREGSDGGTGSNIITHNILRLNNGGTTSDALFDGSGTGSLREKNIVNGTII